MQRQRLVNVFLYLTWYVFFTLCLSSDPIKSGLVFILRCICQTFLILERIMICNVFRIPISRCSCCFCMSRSSWFYLRNFAKTLVQSHSTRALPASIKALFINSCVVQQDWWNLISSVVVNNNFLRQLVLNLDNRHASRFHFVILIPFFLLLFERNKRRLRWLRTLSFGSSWSVFACI